MALAIQGATVLTPAGWAESATVLIQDGRIERIGLETVPPDCKTVNATGLHLLPGLVDLHGDAFDRMICPRPGVRFPLETALLENDRALLAAGITTFYYSITDSFEPELRSRETARTLLQAVLTDLKSHLRVDSQIHIRHEQSNTEHIEELSTPGLNLGECNCSRSMTMYPLTWMTRRCSAIPRGYVSG